MPADRKWRHPVHKTLNFETDRYKEFQDLCWSERKSVSEKIDEMITETLEKKVMGSQNPINVSYGEEQEKPLQLDLTQWIDHVEQVQEQKELSRLMGVTQALSKCINKRSKDLYLQGIKS